MRRLSLSLPAWLLLLVVCAQAPKEEPAPAGPAERTMTTVGERVRTPAATLIDAPPVALKAGGSIEPSAQVCGACHQAQHAEWRASTHASAMEDLQFLAELSKPSSPRWLCLNCHIPLKQQRPYQVQADTKLSASAWDVRGLVKEENLDFKPELIREAVTCAVCHVRRDDDGQGTVIGPRGGAASPHRVRKDPAALDEVCYRCHDPGPVTITPQFFCWFETRREIEAGPRAGSACKDCHMPWAERPPAIGQPATKNRQHLWRGGGPPKTPDRPLGDSALAVRSLDEGGVIRVELTNARAAHMAPSADPERHFLVDVRQLDAAGGELARRVVRVGQTWDWGDEAARRPARRVADNRLRPLETRVYEVKRAPGAARVDVEVKHVRLSVDNLMHMKQARLYDELRALLPEAQAKLREMERHYPLFRYVYKASHAGGAVTPLDPAALEAETRATLGWSVEQLRDALPAGE